MWHNLLTPQHYALLSRERLARLAEAAGWVGVFAAGLGVLTLAPAAIALWGKAASVAILSATTQQHVGEVTKDAQQLLADWRRLVAAQDAWREGGALVHLLENIDDAVPQGVVVERIALQPRQEGESAVVVGTITGTAATRAALRAFEEGLRSLSGMQEVRVPLEAYAPRVDLEFNLSFRWNAKASAQKE